MMSRRGRNNVSRGRRGGRASRQGRNKRNQENSNVGDREERSSPSFNVLPLIIPKKYWCKLTFIDDTFERSNTGANYIYFRLYGNGIYDVDPLLLTSSVRGYPELIRLFSYWIVDSVKVEWTVSNLCDFPLMLYLASDDNDYGTVISSRTRVAQIGELPYSITKSVSTKGGNDRISIVKIFDFPKIEGSRARYYGEDTNYGGIDINPGYQRYIHFGIGGTGNFTSETGISHNLKLTFKVLWSDRRFDLTNTLFEENKKEEKVSVDEDKETE